VRTVRTVRRTKQQNPCGGRGFDSPTRDSAPTSSLSRTGCIAYYEAAAESIEVVGPHAFGEREAAEVEALLKRWRTEHPEAEPEILA
jgi:hypothetical protein